MAEYWYRKMCINSLVNGETYCLSGVPHRPTLRVQAEQKKVKFMYLFWPLTPHCYQLLNCIRKNCQEEKGRGVNIRRTFSITEEKGSGQNDVKTVLCHCRKNKARTQGEVLLQKPRNPSQEHTEVCQTSTWMDGLVEGCSWPFPSTCQNPPSGPNIFTSSYVYLVPAIWQKLLCPQSIQKPMWLLMWLGSTPAPRSMDGDWGAGRQLKADLGATAGRKCLYWREKFALFVYLFICLFMYFWFDVQKCL